LKRLSLLFAAFCMFFAVTSVAGAQQLDVAFGFGTLGGNPASDATVADITAGNATAQTIAGGGYPSFSGDLLFFRKYAGVGGEVTWRARQNVNIFTQPYRPILYDFNAVFAPPLGKHAQAELQAGIGLESIRFYTPFFTCSGSFFQNCTDYSSSNHFLGHFSGGLRLYLTRSVFLRPEVHLYIVHNNIEFAGPRATRYAVSIGYSLKNQF
jgi:hypothetical protein